MKCPTCGTETDVPETALARPWWRRKRAIGLMSVGAAALILMVLAIVYRGHVRSGYHWIVEATGSNAAAVGAVALALVALAVALLWILLPVIIYLGFRSLRRNREWGGRE